MHVGYRDLAGFGRRFMDVAPDELTADVDSQMGTLQAVAKNWPPKPGGRR